MENGVINILRLRTKGKTCH